MDKTRGLIQARILASSRGDKVVICGQEYEVLKVAQYKLRTASWINLVCLEAGKEVAFEVADEDVVKVWRQIDISEFADPVVFGDDAVTFRGEQLPMEESARPQVAISVDPSRSVEARIPYAVYVSEVSEASVCLEDWGAEGLKAFSLEKKIPFNEFQIE